MKKIRIIKGTYGYRPNGGVVVEPKTADSEPFDLEDDKVARLVEIGVAEVVGTATAADNNDAGDGMPAYSKDMKLDELKKIAEAYGVDASKARSKDAVIDMIEAAKAAQDDADDDNDDDDGVVDDGETPPAVGAAMPE